MHKRNTFAALGYPLIAATASALAFVVSLSALRTTHALESQVGLLQAKIEVMEGSRAPARPAPAAHPAATGRRSQASVPAGAPAPLASPGLPNTPESQEARRQAAADWLAEARRSLDAEPRDPVWAASTEDALLQAAGHEDLSASVADMQAFRAECRSRRCFVEANFANRGAALDWLDVFVLQARPISRSMTSTAVQPDGSVSVYLLGGN